MTELIRNEESLSFDHSPMYLLVKFLLLKTSPINIGFVKLAIDIQI